MKIHLAPLFLCLGIFLAFYVPLVRYVGVSQDEVMAGWFAWGMTHPGFDFYHEPFLPIFGLRLPLRYGVPHGPGEIFTTFPFVSALGPTYAAIHIRDAFFALAAVALTYALGWILFRDRWVAFLSCLLLAVCPGFVVGSTLGLTTGISVVAWTLACLYFLALYADRKRPWLAYCGLGCLGVGLCSRHQAAAFLAGLLAQACLFWPAVRDLLPQEPGGRRRFFILCLASLALFLAPMALYTILGRGENLSWFAQYLIRRRDGTSNLDYWGGLDLRRRQLGLLLDGGAQISRWVRDSFKYRVGWQGFYSGAAGISAAVLGWRVVYKGRVPPRYFAPWIVGAVAFLASPFSPTALRPLHILELVPLFYLGICSAACVVRGLWMRRLALAALALLAAHGIYAGNLFFSGLRREMEERGMNETFSSLAARDLGRWLAQVPQSQAVVFTPDLALILRYAAQGRLASVDADDALIESGSRDLRSAGFQKVWQKWFEERENLFVFSTESWDRERFDLFCREARRRGLKTVRVAAFARPDGETLFEVYRAYPETCFRGETPDSVPRQGAKSANISGERY